MAFDTNEVYAEFSYLKSQEETRNYEYYLLRQAVKGNFRWPRDWPRHIPKLRQNLCKPITERFVTYLLGKGFSFNVDRPNTLEFRESAERTEKILRRLLELSQSQLQFDMGAKTGAQLGRTIFKTYKKGKTGSEHACFTYCQPDYFYGVPAGDNHLSEFSTVYYSYPMDILEARRLFGNKEFKAEDAMERGNYYTPLPEDTNRMGRSRSRRIPVFEAWTKDDYLLQVGGVTIHNGENPMKVAKTGDGFVPFVVIENIRNAGETRGEGDIAQARELNEQLNYLISRKFHIVNRWLMPTLVWEGAPQNYGEVLAQTMKGGGAIPARLGSRLSFLSYDRPNPAVLEMEQALRAAILESCGMSEIALQGTVTGSVNTGPGLAAQFQPVLSTVDKKRREWDSGLHRLFAQLLEVQESIGASKALGEAVINQTVASQNDSDGELVPLSGEDIQGLREVTINWPGILPKDDFDAARLEMEKATQGLQSIYTTLEKLGEEFPDDEIARIRMENQDPNLRGQVVAEQIRAQTPLIKAQMEQEAAMQQAPTGYEEEELAPEYSDEELAAQGDVGARLRQVSRATLNTDGEEPLVEAGLGY